MKAIRLFSWLFSRGCINLCFALVLASTSYAAENAVTMFPIERVTPQYPLNAAIDRISGFVMVQFEVSSQGVVSNPVVSFAKPETIFNDSALAAALKLRYRPQIRKGLPIDVKGVQYLFRYNPDEAFDIPAIK